MALQTFTPGQVLTAAQVTALQTNDFNQTVSTKTVSYTLVALDKGTRVVMNSASATTITVNTSLFNAGDTLFIHNIGAGVCTITAGTATVSTAGSLALATNAGGTLYFTSAGVAIFFPTVASSASGLTLINTTSFSAVASQSFNDVFSTTYNSYMLVLNNISCVTGTTNNLMLRLRVSGTDNSSSNYENGRYFVGAFNSTAAASTDSELESRFLIGQMTNAIQQGAIIYVHNPFLTANTTQTSMWAGALFDLNGGVTTVTTSYTGFTLFPGLGGNFAGTVSTYGLVK